MMHSIEIKRVYEELAPTDGYRILVDRIWPRGLTKIKAHLNEWNKEVAPSTELRKWFNHQPERLSEFEKRYKKELQQHLEELSKIKSIAKKEQVTLLFAAKDYKLNNALILKNILNNIP